MEIFKKKKFFVKKIAKKKNGNPPGRIFKILPRFKKNLKNRKNQTLILTLGITELESKKNKLKF
jgi:hypothetical protein